MSRDIIIDNQTRKNVILSDRHTGNVTRIILNDTNLNVLWTDASV